MARSPEPKGMTWPAYYLANLGIRFGWQVLLAKNFLHFSSWHHMDVCSHPALHLHP